MYFLIISELQKSLLYFTVKSFKPSSCRLSPFHLFYVAVLRPCRLSEFYPNRASQHDAVSYIHFIIYLCFISL